jgi:hypothetical protein
LGLKTWTLGRIEAGRASLPGGRGRHGKHRFAAGVEHKPGDPLGTATVMRPYVPRRRMALGWRVILAVALLFLAAFYGLMTAVLPVQLLIVPMVPIMFLLGLCLWLMPDVGGLYDDRFELYMWWILGITIIWPGYVALNLPGLPWISPIRVVIGLLTVTFLFNLATSSYARHEVLKSMQAVPALNRLFWIFWLLTTLTLVMLPNFGAPLAKYMNNQIYWTMMFPVAALVGRREGMIQRAVTILVCSAILVACVSINEYRLQKIIWLEYLPGWLRADEELLEQMSKSSARAYTNVYRVLGPQSTALYFAETLSMLFPFVVHAMYRAKGVLPTLAMAFGVMAMVLTMYFTDARSAMIGLLLTLLAYVFLQALRKRYENPVSLVSASALMAYPAMIAALIGIVLFWKRARTKVLGGGQHGGSDAARDQQWDHGWTLIGQNPFGYGLNRSAEVLGFQTPGGKPTIDSYYLSVMLDFGVIALPIFLMMFTLPMWYALVSLRRARSEELQLIIPIAISLFNFAIIKSVLSSTTNFPLAFILLGFIVALVGRMEAKDETSDTQDTRDSAPKPSHSVPVGTARAAR